MLLLLTTTSAVRLQRGSDPSSPDSFVRLFQPIYFFFSVFEGELSHIQMWKSTVEFLSKGRSCLGRY